MKKLIFVAALAALTAVAVVAQTVRNLVSQNAALSLRAGTHLSCTTTKSAPKGDLLDFTVPAGKTLKGRVSFSGELK
jgi:hypothetical protein